MESSEAVFLSFFLAVSNWLLSKNRGENGARGSGGDSDSHVSCLTGLPVGSCPLNSPWLWSSREGGGGGGSGGGGGGGGGAVKRADGEAVRGGSERKGGEEVRFSRSAIGKEMLSQQ